MKAWLKDLWTRVKADAAKAHKSATILFNAVLVPLLAALPYAQQQVPQLQPYIPEALYNHLMVVVVIGNILLRFKTRTALADKE